MVVSQLLHTVAIGTPLSSAKVIQVCRNEYQVRFLPDVMSFFLRSLDSLGLNRELGWPLLKNVAAICLPVPSGGDAFISAAIGEFGSDLRLV